MNDFELLCQKDRKDRWPEQQGLADGLQSEGRSLVAGEPRKVLLIS